jgi:ABC-2 type transport system ATP-binding protein
MKQKIKLAQAIVHAPRLLFLDEPTNGLDPAGRRRMIQLIQDIRDSGLVHLILSSHILRDVEECCEEVIVLKEGRIVAHCDLEEERRSHHGFLEIETSGDNGDFAEAVAALGCEHTRGANRRIKLVLPDGVGVADLYRIASEKGVQIRRLHQKRDSLEDIFLKAMEEDRGDL